MNREWVEKLIRLMQENPDLPIKCKVDSEIVAEDGYAWWLGQFDTKHDPEIDEYSTNTDDKLFLKSDEDYTEWFEHFFDYEDYDYGDLYYISDDEWDEFAKKKVDEVAGWKKAIFISVTTTVC